MSKYEPLATANRRLKEDKNDAEAQKIYDEHFPMYKNYVSWMSSEATHSSMYFALYNCKCFAVFSCGEIENMRNRGRKARFCSTTCVLSNRYLRILSRPKDWCSTWDGNKYDLVFYGVSGYTGYLMMESRESATE